MDLRAAEVFWLNFWEKITIGHHLSYSLCQNSICMKMIKHIVASLRRVERTVARFGNACLVVDNTGRYELRGGNKEEQAQALEWIAMFMHEAVPTIKSEENERAFKN